MYFSYFLSKKIVESLYNQSIKILAFLCDVLKTKVVSELLFLIYFPNWIGEYILTLSKKCLVPNKLIDVISLFNLFL